MATPDATISSEMAGMMRSPRYQRAMQKLKAMRPEDRALIGPAADELTGKFAADMMGDIARSQQQANQDEYQRANLDLRRSGLAFDQDIFNRNVGLARQKIDWQSGQDDIENLLGVAGIGVGGLGAYMKYDLAKTMMGDEQDYRKRLQRGLAMYRAQS